MKGKWIEMFRTGSQTDSAGNTREWTEQDLDTIVAKYNGGAHEAPIVVGHPVDNSPAFGWVEALKREGKLLYAKLKDVMPEFEELVKAGTYKKRSISLYPDLTLRHIGFLGGMPPAVKGLSDIAFADGDQQPMVIEFCDWKMVGVGRLLSNLRDYLVETLGASKADGILPSYAIQDLQTPPEPEPLSPMYNEPHEEESMKLEEVEQIVTNRVTAALKEFGEAMGKTITGLQATITEMNKVIVVGREEGQRREFREFLMQPEMQRRVNEGSREATISHMMTLTGAAPVEFGEGDSKTTKPALDVYKEQLKALPEVVQFGEFATKDRVTDTAVNGMSAEELAQKAVQFQEAEAGAGRTVTMTDAVAHVKKGGK